MKKIIITIMIILFVATEIGYAQIFKNQENETGSTSGMKDSPANDSDHIYSGSGLFRSGEATGPGGRPGNNEGIGQESEAPLKDGLGVLVACSAIFVFVKVYKRKQKNFDQ